MIEGALRGSTKYYAWMGSLIFLSGIAVAMFLLQLNRGLGITAMSRDVPWGFYIAQMTFLVGVAASAVMVVLPYYLHDHKDFRQMTILGEFLAIPAVLLCPLFIIVDLGQPSRVINLFLHPSLKSMLFWDTVALAGYLALNLIIGWKTLKAERNDTPPPPWIKFLIYLSIPWAFSIHTVTAFIYSGLPARPYWYTAVLAPRFLASAFASGPAILILLSIVLKKFTAFNPGKEAIKALARIVTYAVIFNLFLMGMEIFTVFYGNIPDHVLHFRYLFMGINGETDTVVFFMWLSIILAVCSLLMFLNPRTHNDFRFLAIACIFIIISIWIDKGAGMLTGGFIPSTTGYVPSYFPSLVEILMGAGLYSFGALILTILYRIAVNVKKKSLASERINV